jgi:hypothetical protein
MAGMLDLRTKRQKVTGLAVGSAWTPAAGLVSASSWAPVRNRRRRLAPCSICSPPAPAPALAGGHARDWAVWAEERTNAGGAPRRPAGRPSRRLRIFAARLFEAHAQAQAQSRPWGLCHRGHGEHVARAAE